MIGGMNVFLKGLLALSACAAFTAQAQPRFENTLSERLRACTVCHGEQGRAGPDGYYPRLAGKPAGYLYNQMLNFREGRRHYRLMGQLMEPLSDAYLWEIAHYFADMDLPYPAPTPANATAAQRARGEQLVRHGDAARGVPSCAACHGETLTGRLPHVPGLLGLPRDYLNGQLGAWRTGQRRAHAPDCMARVAQQLGDDDVAAVTAWLSSQPVPPGAKPQNAAPLPPDLACGSATPPTAATQSTAAAGGRP